ncbi:MAG: prephenate dehydrogenase/arogenate dehydrogenase family protein [Syntrophales bacterium]
MKKRSIGIIGGGGGIGCWFARFFSDLGYPVRISERDAGVPLPELAESCPVVVVAVPMAVTTEVIRRVGPYLKQGSFLMDLTSLKEEPVREMLAATAAEVVGCHPLFGPDAADLEGQNVVICPGRGESAKAWLREILEQSGARVVEATPARHDRMMAVIQGLTHLNTMTMGLALETLGEDPAELERMSTPAFRAKQDLLEKVFGTSPRLYAELVTKNPSAGEVIAAYEKAVAQMKRFVEEGDAEGLEKLLRRGV